jgi:hypothetical protein
MDARYEPAAVRMEVMRIKKVEIIPVDIPYKMPFRVSYVLLLRIS